MSRTYSLARAIRWTAAGIGVSAAVYAAYVCVAWVRYGRTSPARGDDADPLLDRFMPEYEIAERHHVRVAAPAAITLAAAADTDLQQSIIIHSIFRARELLLGAHVRRDRRPQGLLAETRSLGWGVLAEVPGREIVVGAVTKPWNASVVFRSLPPDEFKQFREPGYVKIVWTLRADPISAHESIFRTETRVMTTDSAARAKFRAYWARFSPGIVLIRQVLLRLLKAEAERRAEPLGTGSAWSSK